MSKYEIKDAIMLKECMKQIATIVDKYGKNNMFTIDDCPDHIKEAIEWITEMVRLQDA